MIARRLPILGLVAGVLGAASPTCLRAHQLRNAHAVQPERPSVATHAGTVAPGWLEIEDGVEADQFRDGSHAVSVPGNVKLGLLPRTQLNLLIPLVFTAGAAGGLGDVAVGVKWRILEDSPLLGNFAVLPYLKLPTGSVVRATGTGTTDATLLLISSRRLGPVSLDVNLGYTARGGDGTNAPTQASLWTVSLAFPVRGRLGWVAELYGYPATSGPAGTGAYTAVIAGPTVWLEEWLAADVGVIAPLAGPQRYGAYLGGVINAGRLW